MRRLGWAAALVFFGLSPVPAAFAGLAVETLPEHPWPGAVFELRVSGAEVPPGTALEARLGSRSFALWPAAGGRWEGLAAVDRDESAASRDLVVVQTSGKAEAPLVAHELAFGTHEYAVQSITGVDESKVTLSPKDEERTTRENKIILTVLAGRTPERLWSGPFRMPVSGEINGPFGVRREFNGKPRGYHNGVDIKAPRGAKVTATGAGRVVLVGDYFMTGNTVVVDHGLGLYTAYFHMDSVLVAPGDAVAQGATLGLVGSTGRSTGPHLHWGVYVSGVRGDPETFLQVGAVARAGAPAADVAGRPADEPGRKMP